jgi:dephospho-CoA kinase
MLRIGLTGGIGSGKSTVAGIFEVLGIPVYYSDQQARRLINQDPNLKQQIISHFGPSSYLQSGTLDRAFISRQVFQNREKLDLLNHLVHPATIEDSNRWMEAQNSAYALKEAALIFESGAEKYLDYVVGVFAPEALRILRAMARDHVSEKEIQSRIKNQLDENDKMARCDFVILNDEHEAVIPQVLGLHQKLLKLAEK